MKTFEDRLNRLEEISGLLGQDCPIEESLQLFEEGIALSKSLEKELSKIERKVEILVAGPEGEEEGEEEAAEAKPEGKAPARSRGGKKSTKPTLELFPDIEDEEEDD
jgi:exodeoxyribonuclease VII small subunit